MAVPAAEERVYRILKSQWFAQMMQVIEKKGQRRMASTNPQNQRINACTKDSNRIE